MTNDIVLSVDDKIDEQLLQASELSSSSAASSSPITSSDRLVSYAIHEMGDSSQELLPAIPISADMPVYAAMKSGSNENKDGKLLQAPEQSSSSSQASSPVTSSDRYVSYAIHEMGDSSQERLPALPVVADMPVYAAAKGSTNDEQRAEPVHADSIVNINQAATKDDDLTELDATENLTSYSDDVLLQRLHASAPNRDEHLDASSTDEDVDEENFNEFEPQDLTNLHRIIDQITQPSSSLSGADDQAYQRYDVTTASSSNNSSASKPPTDDLYMIPGYPGLWRASGDAPSAPSLLANDADDEGQGSSDQKPSSTSRVKTRVRISRSWPGQCTSLSDWLSFCGDDFSSDVIPSLKLTVTIIVFSDVSPSSGVSDMKSRV